MNLSGINPGDIVYCDVRGDRFWAHVVEHRKTERAVANAARMDPPLRIQSLTGRPIPALNVSARQVVGHWRKSKQSKV